MFENLTNKFEEVFSSFKKAPSLDEKQVDEGLRVIRQALLEADVAVDVAKEFINKVKPKALGQEIIRSTSPGQMVVKIVHDELVDFLGSSNSAISLNAVPPVPIMLVGLQGSGKTTTTAKISRYLEKNNKKKSNDGQLGRVQTSGSRTVKITRRTKQHINFTSGRRPATL